MYRFIETIRLHNGALQNLPYHQERFERTRRERLQLKMHPDLESVLVVPAGLEKGLFRYRVTYGARIENMEIEPYEHPVPRSLKLVRANRAPEYSYKYLDRTSLTRLYNLRGACDDVLIAVNDRITDSYYANVVFRKGTRWYTPDTPLLKGTMRAWLMDQGLLEETHITTDDLDRFDEVRLINALNNLEEATGIPPEKIIR